jgi:hypothetical protein
LLGVNLSRYKKPSQSFKRQKTDMEIASNALYRHSANSIHPRKCNRIVIIIIIIIIIIINDAIEAPEGHSNPCLAPIKNVFYRSQTLTHTIFFLFVSPTYATNLV